MALFLQPRRSTIDTSWHLRYLGVSNLQEASMFAVSQVSRGLLAYSTDVDRRVIPTATLVG